MRLSSKHANQQVIEVTDFSGGLNTSTTEEQIQDNQLAECVNFELQAITGLLKTVDGTQPVYRIPTESTYKLKSAAYDLLNKHIVLFADNGTIFSVPLSDLQDVRQIGRLTNNGNCVAATWEDGLLVASGGRLQYIAGFQLKTIATSPEKCNGSFTRSGRVVVFDDAKVTFSAIGDEDGWTDDTNDDSTSKWIEPGYKQGGKIIGLVNMSSDMLIIKDNGLLLRLVGEYPDWQVKEVARNIDCRSPYGFCSVLNTTYILGQQSIYAINTTQEYGDLKAGNVANQVAKDLLDLNTLTKMRYIPSLNQIWMIDGTENVLMLDVRVGSFFKRKFNARVVDVVGIDNLVYVIKENGFDIISDASYTDEGKNLIYSLKAKTQISQYDYFVKRVVWACSGYSETMHNVTMLLNGTIKTPCPVQNIINGITPIYGNFDKVYTDTDYVFQNVKHNHVVYDNGYKNIFGGLDDVFNNPNPLIHYNAYAIYDHKVRLRDKAIRLTISGQGCKFIINKMKYDVVEV